ncbi:MAG TPA: asparagine synthase-related protein [Candidatus Polarisedimenticolaceae bacterium]|nr:asparagine synthase-related protein [Candidatus Polarisedimenticolaceae bacterium]
MTIAERAYARWGEECVEHLDGDFAVVVSEPHRGRTFAARDPFGSKPLFYRVSAGGIAVASSPEAVAAQDGLPLTVSERRIADVLVGALECGDTTSTLFTDVLRLPPGHSLVFERGRLGVRRWWSADAIGPGAARSDAEHEEEFRALFRDAVRRRLNGKAAVLLSGGLDSSAIAGLARRPGEIVTTFSATSDAPGCEETGAIRTMLSLPGLDGTCVTLREVAKPKDVLRRLLFDPQDPFDATMVIPALLYDEARRRGLDAVLDGVDGDAVASIEPYIVTNLLAQRSYAAAWREARGLGRFYGGGTLRIAAEAAVRVWAPSGLWRWRRPLRIANALEGSLLSDDLARAAEVGPRLEHLWAIRSRGGHDPRRRHAIEVGHPQIPAALERYHRVAASAGIEARHPFLDRRLVEWSLSIPWDLKLRDGWSKWIVRRALRDVVPDAIRWRRGRFVRLGPQYLSAAVAVFRPELDAEVASGLSDLAPYVDRKRLAEAAVRFRAGDAEAGERIWQAVALNSWLRKARARRYDPPERANGPAADHAFSTSGEAVIPH